jgi:hypothetical protein
MGLEPSGTVGKCQRSNGFGAPTKRSRDYFFLPAVRFAELPAFVFFGLFFDAFEDLTAMMLNFR